MIESIGPFEVVRELGRGGMGIVYLARDSRLDRQVAIKALPAHLADDPDRLARFQREAKVLASLNHPNIAALHGLEVSDQVHYLILEYVEGQTLADLLERGPMSVEDARDIAVQIAEALEAAHDKGIVHRDLKPGNIMVSASGAVKVLDFGLARTADGAASSSTDYGSQALSQAVTSPAPLHSPTIAGAIMGTAGYMSPEQARGKAVDKRSDIFSFGCVLYEMLTGAQPFRGETVSDSIGATLHKEFDRQQLPPGVPASIIRVLNRCLAKDRRSRLHDIADARIELQAVESESAPTQSAQRGPSRTVIAGAAIVLAIAAAAAAWMFKPAAPVVPLPVLDAQIVLPSGDRLAHSFLPGVALSRDGSTLAFPVMTEPATDDGAAMRQWFSSRGLALRRMDQPRVIPLTGTPEDCSQPVFSPDGQWIAFVSGSTDVYKTPVAGGQSIKLGEAPGPVVGLSWGADGFILMGQFTERGIQRIAAGGGSFTPVTQVDAERSESGHSLPHSLPGGRGFLFTVYNGDWTSLTRPASVWAHDAASGTRTLVVENASHAQYADGQVVFAREGALMAVSFDLERLQATGDPRHLSLGVVHATSTPNASTRTLAGQFALSPSGTLALAEGSVFPEGKHTLTWVDRTGAEEPIAIDPRLYISARLSPDESRIAMWANYGATRAIWVHDLDRGVTRRLANDASSWAAWGPGPEELTFRRSEPQSIERLGSLRLGSPESAFTPIESDGQAFVADWTPGGERLIAVRPISGGAVLEQFTPGSGWTRLSTDTSSNELWPAVSPDGKWLAYASPESGALEVYVRPLLESGATQQVSIGGGLSPVWSRDGKELFYRSAHADSDHPRGSVASTSITEANGRLQIGKPVVLFADKPEYGRTGPIRSWDVAADGRFLFVKTSSSEDQREMLRQVFPDRIRVIQNWVSTIGR